MNLRRLWAVARKEALHIRRDPRSLGLAIGIPMLMMLMFGYALTLDVDHVPLVVWDQSGTPVSRDYLAHFTGSRYFQLVADASRTTPNSSAPSTGATRRHRPGDSARFRRTARRRPRSRRCRPSSTDPIPTPPPSCSATPRR